MSDPAGFLGTGHELARSIATRAAADGRLAQTLLVHGPPGTGKGTFVADLLAFLLCTREALEARPCNACRPCRLARAGTHPDVAVGSPERWREARAGDESIVATARRWLLEVAGAPISGERRLAVIEGADRCSEQIQNALLKALEEPSPRLHFILVADEPARLLPTIRSRSQALRIGAVPRAALSRWLMDRFDLPRDQADHVARLAAGRIGLAAKMATQPDVVAWRLRLQGQLLVLLGRGRAERFGVVRDALDEASQMTPVTDGEAAEPDRPDDAGPRRATGAQRVAAASILAVWLDLARDLLLAAAGRPAATLTAGLLDELPAAARRVGPRSAARTLVRLQEIHDAVLENASPRLALEVAMLEWPLVVEGS